MQQVVGYRLTRIADGAVIQSWGGSWGWCPGIPNPIFLPNGNHVHAPSLNEDYGGFRLTEWTMQQPQPTVADVVRERERRLDAGFVYTFNDARGAHNIGTTSADMAGWDEVDKIAQALINLGQPEVTMSIVTDTGPVAVTAMEWQEIKLAAAQFRQPIWAKSFILQAMSPIPANFADEEHWS